MNQISSDLNYKSVENSHGTYTLSQVTSQTPLTSIPVSGGVESTFEIPARVCNLGKSYLSFATVAEASGADFQNFQFAEGISCIDSISLYTRQGIFLTDLTSASKYFKATMRSSHKVSDVTTWDTAISGATTETVGKGYFSGLQASKDSDVLRPDGGPLTSSFIEPAYTIVGTVNEATPVINYQVPLSRLVNTVVGMQRDQYFGDITYLRIVWQKPENFICAAKSDVDASGTDKKKYAGTVGLTKLKLFLAIEQDNLIAQELINKFNSNTLSYTVPYVYVNKINVPGSQQNLSTRYNLAHGRRLKKLMWSAFNNVETGATAFDNSNCDKTNVVGSKTTSFYTLLNGTKSVQFDYTTAEGLDYMKRKGELEGSCIGSSTEFYYNNVYEERFDGMNSTSDSETLNVDTGYDLSSGELKFDVVAQMKTAANLNHYIWAVTTKTLSVTPTGITIL
jgi:hypothetical protein